MEMEPSSNNFVVTEMEPSPNNTRFILELERRRLLEEKYDFDRKYGTFSFAFLTSLEAFALLTYFYIAAVLIYHKKTRTKTNIIVAIWAILNFIVVLEKLTRVFAVFIGQEYVISDDAASICQMIAGLARSYGTSLAIVWLFSKYVGTPKPKYDHIIYFLMMIPSFICLLHIFYYFNVSRFVYEVYGPGSDIVNVVVYFFVGFIAILCKIFVDTCNNVSQYALMISLVNLITNVPICMITIYLRFNLDIGWHYRFHIYFVDFFINIISCSNAFLVLFIIILYHRNLKFAGFMKKREVSFEEVSVETKSDFC